MELKNFMKTIYFSNKCIVCGFDHKKEKKKASKAHRIKRNIFIKNIKKPYRLKEKNMRKHIEEFEDIDY